MCPALRIFIVLAALCACSRESGSPPAEAPQDSRASTPTAAPADSHASTPAAAPEPAPPLPSALDQVIEPHTGDLPEMLQRRQIRALVAIDRTHFFFDRGAQKGITADALVEFERWINAELKTKKNLKMQVVVVPVRRDQLLPALLSGRGDIIAVFVTDTPERRKVVDFADAGFQVTEVFVRNAATPAAATVDDLSGREVWVRRGTAYFESLEQLNRDLAQRKLKPVVVRELDPSIEDDEALEMVNAGVIPATVTNRYIAKLWAPILPELQVQETIQLRSNAPFTWAVRKENPQVRALVGKFQKAHGEGTLWGNMKFKEYFTEGKFIRNPGKAKDAERLRQTRQLFEQYGTQYSLDWLLLAAQAYQESGLDNKKKSPVGAVGIMQVMPATARDPRVRVKNIEQLDRNIEAGTKYLRLMIDDYYEAEPMTRLDKALFSLASYNAGPARVAKLRAEAGKLQLDPNIWFDNVEIVAARRIGAETVTYVRNIYKYYLAYKLLEEQGRLKSA
ncbi:MAG TPA: transporter substrate-binding domain-containing protein [Steroidobacteraceae bacterium]|jgi:membrane-bound lytic murein transglycosylase MltF|nr:transporter substrate-binding domain-containing protein [Steroidobacteraceae bacterium]